MVSAAAARSPSSLCPVSMSVQTLASSSSAGTCRVDSSQPEGRTTCTTRAERKSHFSRPTCFPFSCSSSSCPPIPPVWPAGWLSSRRARPSMALAVDGLGEHARARPEEEAQCGKRDSCFAKHSRPRPSPGSPLQRVNPLGYRASSGFASR